MLFLTTNANNYIGYVKINSANVKVMTAKNFDDVRAYISAEGYTKYKLQRPKGNLYIMKRVKEW